MTRLLLLSSLLALGGCIQLDGIWFGGVVQDEYVLPFNEIPDELIEEVQLEGEAVDDEGAPTLFGHWVHPCAAAREGGACGNPRDDVKILYFHGNSRSNDQYWDRIQNLWRMEPRPEDPEGYVPRGYQTFMIDYRGYGRSSGTSSEAGFFADGQTAYDHVRARMDDDDLLVIYGFSIGSAVATDVAVNNPHDLFILEAAVASSQAFVDDAIGVGFDQSVLMDTRFDNVAKIGAVDTPKLFMHGRNDDFVRIEFGKLLFDRAAEPKEPFFENDGRHSSVPCPTLQPGFEPRELPCNGDEFYYELIDDFVARRLGLNLD